MALLSNKKYQHTCKHWRNDKVNYRIWDVITILTQKETTYFVTCCRSRTEMSEVEELISCWISAKNDSLKRVTRGFMNSIRNGLPVKNEKKVSISTGKAPECATKFRWKRFQERNQTTTMILRCCPFLKICKVIGSDMRLTATKHANIYVLTSCRCKFVLCKNNNYYSLLNISLQNFKSKSNLRMQLNNEKTHHQLKSCHWLDCKSFPT